jgi:hypothetical protein
LGDVAIKQQQLNDTCQLCKVFTDNVQRVFGDNFSTQNTEPTLLVFKPKAHEAGRITIWITIPINADVHSQGSWVEIEPRPLPEPGKFANLESLRSLLEECIDRHVPGIQLDPRSQSHIIKVIDCHLRMLVGANDEPYITLSYVWSSQKHIKADDNGVIRFLPTIEDAVSVTSELGYR